MSNELSVQSAPAFVKASDKLSLFLGIPKDEMLTTIKAQCFRSSRPDEISNAQLAAFISIANDMGVNPLLPGMLYAYPDRGAIFPIMGPDGVFKKLAESSVIESWETTVYPEDPALPPTHATTKIWRRGIDRPVSYTALLSEWKVNSNPNWNTRPRHMLTIRSLKQAARQIIHGLPGDEDDRVIAGIVNVTGTAEGEEPAKRPPAPARAAKGSAAVKENTDKAAAIETSATPVEEKKPEPEKAESTPAPQAAKQEAAAAPLAQEAAGKVPAPRKSLNEAERSSFLCTVESFKTKIIPSGGIQSPSVLAILRGEYDGNVFHLNGATQEGDKLKEQPAWQLEKNVVAVLFGKKDATGVVRTLVESIRLEGEPEAETFN